MTSLQSITTQSEGRDKVSGGKRHLPNLPQLLPIWATAISHSRERPTEREAEIEQQWRRKTEKNNNMAFSTCCSFKWVLPASRAGAIIQLPACTQAKPARLVHLHKRQPRRVHMQTHTARTKCTQTQPLLHISCSHTQAGRAGGFKREGL